MERARHSNGDHFDFHEYREIDRGCNGGVTSKPLISSHTSPSRPGTPPLPNRPVTPPPPSQSCSSAANYIEHRVSKLDTLAGVAIKYGVEVADIKRINGLVTDLQMFALKSLRIPLPGRHSPSPCLSKGLDDQGPSSSEKTPGRRRHSDLFESFISLKPKSSPPRRVSPAMSNLQGYYGLKPPEQKTAYEGFEMAVYRKTGSHYVEDGLFAQPSPNSNPSLNSQRRTKSMANGLLSENGELTDDMAVAETQEADSDKWNDKLLRRRQKSEADFTSRTPETLLKEDTSSVGGFSAITGKGLALRPKVTSRVSLGVVDAEAGLLNPIPIGLGDSLLADGFNSASVRKSSSTSSLQEQENGGTSSSVRPTSKWSLKSDLHALSSAAISKPIFDGLQNPITGRKNKAALD